MAVMRLTHDFTEIAKRALREDIGRGDVTSQAVLPADLVVRGELVTREEGVVAGLEVCKVVFGLVDDPAKVDLAAADGEEVLAGRILAEVRGPAIGILSGERVALNFLQRMSGIATLTRRFVREVAGTGAVILDTRKTAPGLRVLDKMAVRLGGGQNHRFGLYDMVLIKDNHIAACGSITEAVKRARADVREDLAIEVEVRSMDEFCEALGLKPDRIMLDNMRLNDMAQAVDLAGGKVELEASGSVTLQDVREIAQTGVDFISVGALTHSVRALDISLEIT